MKIKIITALCFLVMLLCGTAKGNAFTGQWKVYPTFDNYIDRVLDTPDRVYILALGQEFKPTAAESETKRGYLFSYEKDSEEMVGLNRSNSLSGSVISAIEYNPVGKYLIIIYEDFDIDLLYDNGKVVNIPAIKSANIPSSKTINSINFDYDRGMAYLATDFGFFVINDRKGEIYQSRIYNKRLLSAARLGDLLYIVDEEGNILRGNAGDANFSISDFTPIQLSSGSLSNVERIFPLHENVLGVISISPSSSTYKLLDTLIPDSSPANSYTVSRKGGGSYKSLSAVKDGYYVWETNKSTHLSESGATTSLTLPDDMKDGLVSTADGKEFWECTGRKGLRSFRHGNEWSVTRDYMMPNAPSILHSQGMAYHPTYGMLVSNRGNRNYFERAVLNHPILLSALKDGEWIRHGLPYTNPAEWRMMYNPTGLAIDPKNPDYVYFGSQTSGIGRVNLRNPEDLLHMSAKSDGASKLPSFAEIAPVQKLWSASIQFADPYFDREGNLWTVYNNLDSSKPSELWVWPRANIDATTGPSNVKPWIKMPIDTKLFSGSALAVPLTSNGNTTRVMVSVGQFEQTPIIYDYRGTLANTGDDLQVSAPQIYDQDGQPIAFQYVRTMYEDPTTGLVWVGTDAGLFIINPSNYISNPSVVSRVKVSRDDGTSLADYLLNGVEVAQIIDDPYGRKWFATVGGGIVCTSADGRIVKGEWTTENSLLPSNDVYAIGWNNATGSLMISTDKGLAEFFPAGEGTGENFDNLRVYPNPVRPDYRGWITIDGLTDGALVKLTDAHGNLVRELGRVEGGTIQWDGDNMNGRRVPSGVYYIMASGGESDSSLAKVGKVLVVN